MFSMKIDSFNKYVLHAKYILGIMLSPQGCNSEIGMVPATRVDVQCGRQIGQRQGTVHKFKTVINIIYNPSLCI